MNWPLPPNPITLDPKQIHIWRICLDPQNSLDPQNIQPHILTYQQCLSAEEQARADRFRFERDRSRFIQSRGSLRHILSRYLGCSAAGVSFTYGEYGKPQISKPISKPVSKHANLTFNLSHSEDLALCAVGYGQRLGIDLEHLRPLTHFESLSRRCLCDSEIQAITSLSEPQAQRQFLQYWTCKEAYLKAIGCGLTQSLQSVEVQLNPVAQLLGPAHDWRLKILDPAPGFVAAVVSEEVGRCIRYEWNLPKV